METSLNLVQQQQDLKVKKEEEKQPETAGSIAMGETNTPSPLFNAETAGSIASAAPSSVTATSSASFSAMA